MLVRVHRSGVNPTDWKSRRGIGFGSGGDIVGPPQVPGQDGAGVVEAAGPGVDAALVGARVWVWEAAFGRAEGTTQELAVIPVQQVVPLPRTASFDLGACLGIPFLTRAPLSHPCRGRSADPRPRHAAGPGGALVPGGAGGVGNAAIQLARW